ncbi:LOW QUALITY PROTEIN: hypothetical protein Cgig2_011743 [Carnegiea gigantea]|uniref:non-specific serine/threonine protein kinase n=1 Tax=Carnegiea gigantea TaxID=171969 RepID=A0A9Q1QKC5_9CARY|nr:LOW QUALITY PROTEIN: hypothetical protein Cgig2_011743 [Carnegiea gigantea]
MGGGLVECWPPANSSSTKSVYYFNFPNFTSSMLAYKNNALATRTSGVAGRPTKSLFHCGMIQGMTDFSTHFSFALSSRSQLSSLGTKISWAFAHPGSESRWERELALRDHQLDINGPLSQVPPPPCSQKKKFLTIQLVVSLAFSVYNNASVNPFVAVEFDSFQNPWDSSRERLGINVNSAILPFWHIIDLKDVLPEKVKVGFSAATGRSAEIHNILSWSFNSTLEDTNSANNNTNHPPNRRKSRRRAGLVRGVVAGIGLGNGIGLCWIFERRSSEEANDMDFEMDDDFEKGVGPKRFPYGELNNATNNFAKERKLGEKGFRGVYIGLLMDPNREFAVNRISRDPNKGKSSISSGGVMIRVNYYVYEFMPNYQLPSLWRQEVNLSWIAREKISLGLVLALLYLHEEWEQCVVPKDIKSSNAWGLWACKACGPRVGSVTAVLAGTLGYLAPECVTTRKAGKESDVYSFGKVALEISYGRRPVVWSPKKSLPR